MKRLIFLNGPMGAGKTTVGTALSQLLPRSAFLDGDWCWTLHPFTVTDETKAMVLDNIAYLLNNFLHCSAVDNVIFCWVMQNKIIVDAILSRLDLTLCQFELFTLDCCAETLRRRLEADVAAGTRQPDAVERGLSYLPYYAEMNSTHIFTDHLTPAQAAEKITQFMK